MKVKLDEPLSKENLEYILKAIDEGEVYCCPKRRFEHYFDKKEVPPFRTE